MTPKRLQFARQLAGKSCSDLPRFDLRLEKMSSFRSTRDVGASRSSQRIREVNELRDHFSLARRPSLGFAGITMMDRAVKQSYAPALHSWSRDTAFAGEPSKLRSNLPTPPSFQAIRKSQAISLRAKHWRARMLSSEPKSQKRSATKPIGAALTSLSSPGCHREQGGCHWTGSRRCMAEMTRSTCERPGRFVTVHMASLAPRWRF